MTPKEITQCHYVDARSVYMGKNHLGGEAQWQIAATIKRQIRVVGSGRSAQAAWFDARTRIRTASTDEYWFELISGRISRSRNSGRR